MSWGKPTEIVLEEVKVFAFFEPVPQERGSFGRSDGGGHDLVEAERVELGARFRQRADGQGVGRTQWHEIGQVAVRAPPARAKTGAVDRE